MGELVHGDKGNSTDFDIAALGTALRVARRARGRTVEQLAAAAGVSTGLISQLERGQGNPAFLTLRRLAEALGLPIAHFVQGPTSTGMVVRADARKKLTLPDAELVYELLTPDLRGRLEVLRTQVPAGWSNESRPFVHVGEECIHLLTGRLEAVVGTARFALDEGDSITYDSGVPHWWSNPTESAAVIIGIVTPPSF